MIMKKLMTVAFLFVVLQAWTQGFEGTVKWSMKMDITDPKMKAEMEKGQKQMDDPARQAEMKEMEEKMNDPQMKDDGGQSSDESADGERDEDDEGWRNELHDAQGLYGKDEGG